MLEAHIFVGTLNIINHRKNKIKYLFDCIIFQKNDS